jgi:hypothetical protein
LFNINILLFSFGPPFQGLDGLSCQTQGDCPGLELDRAVGAGNKNLISGSFRAKWNAQKGNSFKFKKDVYNDKRHLVSYEQTNAVTVSRSLDRRRDGRLKSGFAWVINK